MLRKLATIIGSTIVGTILYARVKEKRSYKSFLQEKMIRMSGMKKTFENVQDAEKALEETKYETAGKYSGTDYEFSHGVQIKDYDGSLVYIVNDEGQRDQRTILYIHGGAWFQDPLDYHFEYMDLLADSLNAKVVMPIYPKIPHRDYRITFELLTKLYHHLLNKIDDSKQMIIMGDSAGGQIALAFVQQLKKDSEPQPSHIVLISPVLDATFSNPEARKYEKEDPMLGLEGSKYLVNLWAGDAPVDHYKLSPMYGDLEDLGHITITTGTKETLYPDAVKFSTMLNEKGINHEFIPGYSLFHIYPIFPIPERERFLEQLKRIILK